jgi:hypothetical protein
VDKLEKHRGFRPDRVTANIIIKAWFGCLSAPTYDHDQRRLAKHTRQGSKADEMGKAELKALFGIVKRLMEDQESGTNGFDKHVRPFGVMMERTMRARGDWEGAKEVKVWVGEMLDAAKGGRGRPFGSRANGVGR